MCNGCPPSGKAIPSVIEISSEEENYNVKIDRSPKGVLGHVRFFILEGEKLGLVVLFTNSLFHLTAPFLRLAVSSRFFDYCLRFHEIGHEVSHLTEPLHLFADLTNILKQDFIVKYENNSCIREKKCERPINYKATAGRVCHLAANLFSFLGLVADVTILLPAAVGGVIVFSPWLHAIGAAFALLSILELMSERKAKEDDRDDLNKRALLNFSGIVCHIAPIIESLGVIGPVLRTAELVSDVASLVFAVISIKLIVIPGLENQTVAKEKKNEGGSDSTRMCSGEGKKHCLHH